MKNLIYLLNPPRKNFRKVNANKTNSESDKAKKAYKILMSIFIILSGFLLALSIFLMIQLNKKSREILSKSYVSQK